MLTYVQRWIEHLQITCPETLSSLDLEDMHATIQSHLKHHIQHVYMHDQVSAARIPISKSKFNLNRRLTMQCVTISDEQAFSSRLQHPAA